MLNNHIIFVFYLMWGMLVFTTICFLISGIDDLIFDGIYWSYIIWRKWVLGKTSELSYTKWIDLPQKKIAVMIPCWHEAGVIEAMLKYNTYTIEYENYDFFVGLYPNDPHTVSAVQEIAAMLPHIKYLIGPMQGPSSKAANLNLIYQYMQEYEKNNGLHYSIIVMHDSEDIIHPLSFHLYNYLIPLKAMVQLPVYPLETKLTQFTHWVYAAEFSEAHTKDLIVREKIGGLVPSAGVSTGFSREVIDLLAKDRGGVPFATNTLTEDYDTALRIRLLGFEEIFVTQYVYRTKWRKRWYLFGAIKPYVVKDYIATRAMFPTQYMKSVRQKTRWILGIGFEEWINTGWGGNFATLYTLLHDRKSLFTHFITGLFFILISFFLFYSYYTAGNPDYPTLQDLFDQYPLVWQSIWVASILMLVRIIERMIAVFKIYGLLPALLAGPLILYGNIINLHALMRAYYQFIFSTKAKAGTIAWDKTDHDFPVQRLLMKYKSKLGDILVHHGILTEQQLHHVLLEQNQSGEKLGSMLLRLNYVSQKQLNQALAEQYNIPLVAKRAVIPLKLAEMKGISPFTYTRLRKAKVIPIALANKTLTVVINDPSNEVLLAAIIRWVKPYTVKFMMTEC